MASGKYERKPEQKEKHRANSIGEKNPNWKGGIKSLDKKKYYKEYSREYKKKRRKENKKDEPKKKIIRVRVTKEQKREKRLKTQLTSLHRRRARIKSIGGSFTYGEWETLKKQYNNTCPACYKQEPVIKLTVDHIVPIKHGGSNNIENIQPLCKSCNSKKSSKLIPKYDLLV